MTVGVGCNGSWNDYCDQNDCNHPASFLAEKQSARLVDVRGWYRDGGSGVCDAMNICWVYFPSYFNIISIKVNL